MDLDIPLLEPGVAIGHFKLGATWDALTAAGHEIEPHPSGQLGETVKVSGPFELVFTEQGRLTSIALDLTRSQLRQGTAQSHVILSDKTPVEELMKTLGCGPIEVLDGGNTATCVGGTRFDQAGPVLRPSVRVFVGP
ncbi:hypothetical protein [Nannocystis pusilla]|uniref:Uncharacterized protein n=1 Tax=Nannocystis pusilla TaxID=889268 RepID=A0ABS7TMM7_9BACT|nr:hypothetical protein [Nannocystis pusilla]MBZ5709478.1 hypothetical protein [Nannocystis pusilla]